jgi:molecular chaperone GrpE
METSDEEFVSEEEAEGGPAALKKLRERLKKAVEEKQEYLEGWQRSRADFANYKREEALIHASKEERIKREFVESLLPALDSFETAFAATWYHDAAPEWKAGIMSIYRELVRSLDRFGVTLYSPLGEAFDPSKHEALRQTAVLDEKEDNTVVSVERSGYNIGDTIIRPAQVTIGVYNK